MNRLKTNLVFISLFILIYLLRLANLDSPLPPSWTVESKVGFTALILDLPDQTDSKTVIRNGRWTVYLRGIKQVEIGKTYKFVGNVKTKALGGKIYKIEMIDPTFEIVNPEDQSELRCGERVIIALNLIRNKMITSLQEYLPEPQASLAAGILLGAKAGFPNDFYQALINSGTLHIVAASGYNVNVVAGTVISMLAGVVGRAAAIVIGGISIAIYVLLTGASAAVVRAGVMGGLILTASFLGRPVLGRRIFWLTAAIMMVVDPLIITEVGFLLSISAMGGLLYIQPVLEKWIKIKNILTGYFYPTLAATIATLPVTYLVFGRVSMWGLFSNLLILPLIPLTMLLTTITLIIPAAHYLLMVLLTWLVEVISWWR